MLVREGELIFNRKRHPVALIDECENCILINRAYWNDRIIRTRVSELTGGTKRHLKMPYELVAELTEKYAV